MVRTNGAQGVSEIGHKLLCFAVCPLYFWENRKGHQGTSATVSERLFPLFFMQAAVSVCLRSGVFAQVPQGPMTSGTSFCDRKLGESKATFDV